MTETNTENWPLTPLGAIGLAVSVLGIGTIIAGGLNMLEHGWAYGLGNLFLFGGICFYFFVSWVLD
jgi:hypothetical protein